MYKDITLLQSKFNSQLNSLILYLEDLNQNMSLKYINIYLKNIY